MTFTAAPSVPPAAPPVPVVPPGPGTRLHLTARSAGAAITAMVGGLAVWMWLVLVLLSPFTILAPLVLPATLLVRSLCNAQRRWVSRLTGTELRAPYRPLTADGWPRRVRTVLGDPATWRDAVWLLWQSMAGCTLTALSAGLLLSSVFYLIYPLLYAVTPQTVFGQPFGPWWDLHSVAASCAVMPMALVCFLLWYATVLPLARLEARLARTLLAARG